MWQSRTTVPSRALPDLLYVQALTSPLLRFRLGGDAVEPLDARPPAAGSVAVEMSRLSGGTPAMGLCDLKASGDHPRMLMRMGACVRGLRMDAQSGAEITE